MVAHHTENKMTTHSNIGIYLSNQTDKQLIIDQILGQNLLLKYADISALQGFLHSSITINRFIDEEERHDQFLIHTNQNASLSSMSSGQQKMALLNYILAQKPQYILLDDVYSNMDVASQQSIKATLEDIASTTLLIQIFFRKADILPSIKTVFTINQHNQIVKEESAQDFINTPLTAINLQQFILPKQYNESHLNINPLIQLNNIEVNYMDKQVIKNINWTIKKGEFWQLICPNGSGKSTLLSIITGDNPRGYGQDMILFGKQKGSGETIWDIKQQIGYFTPSMIHHFSHLNTVENMIISGLVDSVGLYTKPTELQREIANSWIEMIGTSYHHRAFHTLSLGQKSMVMVARAMVKHPPLLILDEPTVELDDENSALFVQMINAIAQEKQVAILYVSHRAEPALTPHKKFELVREHDWFTGHVTNINQ